MAQLERITFDPNVMGGKPCIRGMRVTVGMIVGLVASGATSEDILADYPYLEADDITAARCRMRRGDRRKSTSRWFGHEVSDRHEPVAQVVRHPAGRRLGQCSLVPSAPVGLYLRIKHRSRLQGCSSARMKSARSWRMSKKSLQPSLMHPTSTRRSRFV